MTQQQAVYSNEPPTDTWAKEVCKVGQGHACCRFLMRLDGGWSCEKSNPYLRETLDRRAENRQMVARGDNCTGKKSRR